MSKWEPNGRVGFADLQTWLIFLGAAIIGKCMGRELRLYKQNTRNTS